MTGAYLILEGNRQTASEHLESSGSRWNSYHEAMRMLQVDYDCHITRRVSVLDEGHREGPGVRRVGSSWA